MVKQGKFDVERFIAEGKDISDMTIGELKELISLQVEPIKLKKRFRDIENWNGIIYARLRKDFREDFDNIYGCIWREIPADYDYRFRRRWQYIAPLLLEYEAIHDIKIYPLISDLLRIQPFLWDDEEPLK